MRRLQQLLKDPIERLLLVNTAICAVLFFLLLIFAWNINQDFKDSAALPLLDAEAELIEGLWLESGKDGIINYINNNKSQLYRHIFFTEGKLYANLKPLPQLLNYREDGTLGFDLNDKHYIAITITFGDNHIPPIEALNEEGLIADQTSISLEQFWGRYSDITIDGELDQSMDMATLQAIADQDELLIAIDQRFISQNTDWFGVGLWLLCLVPLLALFASWWWLSQIKQQLQRVNEAAQAISQQGQLQKRIEQNGIEGPLANTIDQLNSMLDRIQAAVLTSQDQANNIAHDLRTPLTAAYSQLQLLAEDHPELHQAEQQLAKLNQVFQQLLRIHRLENQLEKPKLEPLPLADIVCDAIELYEPVLQLKHQCFKHQARDIYVLANPDMLLQLLCNLIDNASKFSPFSETIRIDYHCDQDKVEIHISNTISDNSLSHIHKIDKLFEKFYRHDSSRSQSGNGLGLSFAKAAVEAQQGTLGAKLTKADKGGSIIVFSITLPRK